MSTPAEEQPTSGPTLAPDGPEQPAGPDSTAEAQPTPDTLPKARTSRRRKPRAKPAAGSSTSSTSKPRARPATKRRTRVDITKGLTTWYVTVGATISAIPSPQAAEPMRGTVAQVIGLNMAQNAEECAAAWAQLADENQAVREVLERVLTVSAVAAVVTAHLPILAAAGIATGVVPPQAGAIIAALMADEQAPAPAPEAPAAADRPAA